MDLWKTFKNGTTNSPKNLNYFSNFHFTFSNSENKNFGRPKISNKFYAHKNAMNILR